MTNFMIDFHNLQGLTIAEKRRNFFHLLNKHSTLTQNQSLLNTIISTLKPETHLEKLFYADFLIKFQRYEEIFQAYITGNDIIVRKIAKEKWFFRKLYDEKKSENFVENFLPTVSYSIRIKILRKFAVILSETENNALFDALLKQYGAFIASNVLIGCSINKIELILKTHPIKLSCSELKTIYTKSSQLIYIYLEERKKYETKSKFLTCDPFIKFIATQNTEMFCNLQETYKIEYCRIGKHSTKKIVKAQKNRIMAKPKLYAETLHLGRLVRTLGNENFQQFYSKVVPHNIDQFFSQWESHGALLKQYVKHHQFSLFERTFNSIFYDDLKSVCPQLNKYRMLYMLELIPNGLEREKWISLKSERNDYLKYMKAETCFDFFKNKFSQAPISKKCEIIKTITESCLMDKDFSTLFKVCDLIDQNNDAMLQRQFLNTLKFMEKFETPQWNRITKILKTTEDIPGLVILQYIEFELKQGTLNKGEILFFLKKSDWISCLENFSSTIKRDLVLLLIELAPNALKSEVTIENIDVRLVAACRKQKISPFLHPRLLQSIKNSILDDSLVENDVLYSVVSWIVCTKNDNEIIEEIRKLYWEKLATLATAESLSWFLNHKPKFVIDNFEAFLTALISDQLSWRSTQTKQIWYIIKSYEHLAFDSKVLNYCRVKLSSEDFTSKLLLTDPLSVLMSTKDFVKLLTDFKPSNSKVDQLNDKEKQHFLIQRNLLKCCVKFNEPEILLPIILLYFNGDYVASCLSPVYSCLYRIPQNCLKPILDSICSIGAVSAKKHGFYITCVTQNESQILETLKHCNLTQSIAMTYQHFVKNPSEPSWTLLKEKLQKLDNNDHFTCLLLANKLAPILYRSQYFETAFDVFKSKQNRFTNVLLDKLDHKTVGQLSNNFFQKFQENFFEMRKSELIFTSYIFYGPENKFEIISNVLEIFKRKNWSNSNECREKLGSFIKTIFDLYFDLEITDSSLVVRFLAIFQKNFSPFEAIEEFIYISLMRFKKLDIDQLVVSLRYLHQSLIHSYGKLISKIVADCLSKALIKFCSDETEIYRFYASLLNGRRNTHDVILLINLLPRTHPKLKERAKLYYELLRLLLQEEQLEFYLNVKFEEEEIALAKNIYKPIL